MAKVLLGEEFTEDFTRRTSQDPDDVADEQISQLGAHSASPFAVLHLNKEVLLDGWKRRAAYQCVQTISRMLPALIIYGGTAGLLICALCKYRWGVLVSLTLYSFYMLHLCVAFFVFACVGLVRVYVSMNENWHEKYQRHSELRHGKLKPERWANTSADDGSDEAESGELGWDDVIHVVMLPSYKTPLNVLEDTLEALLQFSMSKTNLGVCLAFEERERAAVMKAAQLRESFESRFRFFLVTFHPAHLPNHLPGKSSNECWAFLHMRQELEEVFGISNYDPRVIITVIDDDSNLHENYFEALTYHFLTATQPERYASTWQPPICQMKNYLRQPLVVRISALFATLNELACMANPMDCHVPFSTYSLSLVLASAVGGWDPEYLAEDWHMFAKCSLMTEGRIRCRPIFLPLLNYTPEEETYFGTIGSRFAQAKRHALGVSEVVYVISTIYLALLELPSLKRALVFLWRMLPLLAKFTQVHFVNGMSAIWSVLAQLVIHFYMLRSWCYMQDLKGGTCSLLASASAANIGDEQMLLNSWLVQWQQRATAIMGISSVLAGGLGAFYFHLVKDRVEGDVEAHWNLRYPLVTWLVIEIEVAVCGLMSSVMFGAAPLWFACIRILCDLRFSHVSAGMLGRGSDDDDDKL